ncbi:MAG: hypothetical protein JWQ04_3405 [Pedosphaera sp.]|nr:hypothetical protein [Pedosphaera sp.]
MKWNLFNFAGDPELGVKDLVPEPQPTYTTTSFVADLVEQFLPDGLSNVRDNGKTTCHELTVPSPCLLHLQAISILFSLASLRSNALQC